MTNTYTLINYFDVWGNDEDGYTVNDCMVSGTIKLPDNASDSEIITTLKEYGALGEFANEDTIEITGDDLMIELCKRGNGYPLYSLRRES